MDVYIYYPQGFPIKPRNNPTTQTIQWWTTNTTIIDCMNFCLPSTPLGASIHAGISLGIIMMTNIAFIHYGDNVREDNPPTVNDYEAQQGSQTRGLDIIITNCPTTSIIKDSNDNIRHSFQTICILPINLLCNQVNSVATMIMFLVFFYNDFSSAGWLTSGGRATDGQCTGNNLKEAVMAQFRYF